MTRSHRLQHRIMVVILFLAVIGLFVLGLRMRNPEPVSQSIPEALLPTGGGSR